MTWFDKIWEFKRQTKLEGYATAVRMEIKPTAVMTSQIKLVGVSLSETCSVPKKENPALQMDGEAGFVQSNLRFSSCDFATPHF